jgi:hypothetical protein
MICASSPPGEICGGFFRGADMKIKYERFDFAKGTVEEREREIDSSQVLANNALFQRLASKRDYAPSSYVAPDGDCA